MNNIDILEEELRKDILYQIDMQLYDEFNDKFCEIEENLGTVYSYKDLEDLKKAESDTERRLLRQAISTLIAENKELKEENKCLKNKELDYMTVYLTGTYDERDKWKSKLEELKKYEEGYKLLSYSLDNYISKDKIKAKIGKRMQKNNNTIHNVKLKHGKDYVYYDEVQEAKEENRICKEILQSLLGKE